jgi:hypothetical protein
MKFLRFLLWIMAHPSPTMVRTTNMCRLVKIADRGVLWLQSATMTPHPSLRIRSPRPDLQDKMRRGLTLRQMLGFHACMAFLAFSISAVSIVVNSFYPANILQYSILLSFISGVILLEIVERYRRAVIEEEKEEELPV